MQKGQQNKKTQTTVQTGKDSKNYKQDNANTRTTYDKGAPKGPKYDKGHDKAPQYDRGERKSGEQTGKSGVGSQNYNRGEQNYDRGEKKSGEQTGKSGVRSQNLYSDFQQVREAVRRGETPISCRCDLSSANSEAKEILRFFQESGYRRQGGNTDSEESTWVK